MGGPAEAAGAAEAGGLQVAPLTEPGYTLHSLWELLAAAALFRGRSPAGEPSHWAELILGFGVGWSAF